MRRELDLLRALYANRIQGVPSKLNLNITNVCQSRCLTCDVWKVYSDGSKTDGPKRLQEELTSSEIERLLLNAAPHIKWLTIAGGEPFLRKDLQRLIDFVIYRCPSILLLTIPTNGLDHKRTMACLDQIKDQQQLLIAVTFSLDGPREVHDRVRGVEGGFDKTWKVYSDVRELLAPNEHFRVGLETTVSKFNVADVPPFLDDLISGGHDVVITVAHNAPQYHNAAGDGLLPEAFGPQIEDLVSRLRRHVRGFSPEAMLKRVYLENCVGYVNNQKKRVLPCTALLNSLAINPYGDVHPCTMWDRKLGNIRDYDYDLMRVWDSPEKRETRSLIAREDCPNCWTPCEAYQSITENFYRPNVLRNLL